MSLGVPASGSRASVSDVVDGINRGVTFGASRVGILKKLGGGINMHSVLEALPFLPMCISRSNILEILLISVTPLICLHVS